MIFWWQSQSEEPKRRLEIQSKDVRHLQRKQRLNVLQESYLKEKQPKLNDLLRKQEEQLKKHRRENQLEPRVKQQRDDQLENHHLQENQKDVRAAKKPKKVWRI